MRLSPSISERLLLLVPTAILEHVRIMREERGAVHFHQVAFHIHREWFKGRRRSGLGEEGARAKHSFSFVVLFVSENLHSRVHSCGALLFSHPIAVMFRLLLRR